MEVTETDLNSCKIRQSMKNAIYTGRNNRILLGGPGKDSCYRNVTVKQTLSSHLGRFTILALMEAFRNTDSQAVFQTYQIRVSRVRD